MRTGRAAGGWRGSLRLRLLAGTLVWISLSVLVAGWGLARLFERHVEQQLYVELGTHLNQLAAHLRFDPSDRPQLALNLSDPRFTRPYSGLYWQVDAISVGDARAQTALLRSRSLWDAMLVVPADVPADGELHAHRVDGPDGEPLRVIERVLRPADFPESSVRLVVAANEVSIARPVADFSGLLAMSLGLLAFGLLAAAWVQIRLGLQPFMRLRGDLEDVKEGRSRMIEGQYPAEVRPLVDEFNAVLARNAQIVERARTQAGNLAHAVKTPLTVLANAAAATDGALAQLVAEQVALARTQVDYHLARSRAAAAAGIPGQRTALKPVLEGLVRLMMRVHAERALRILLTDCPPSLVFRGDVQDLQEMLGNLLDNACKWAASTVELRADAVGDEVNIVIDDDGPGLPPGIRQAMFERGVRADEQIPGSGLGLAIVRDLAQLYGGGVELEASPLGGLRARLRLPR